MRRYDHGGSEPLRLVRHAAVTGLAGAILLVGFCGSRGAAGAAILVAIGLWPAWRHARAGTATQRSAEGQAAPSGYGLRALCARSLLVWTRQIEASKEAAEQAVLGLTRLFGSTVKRIETTLIASRNAVSELHGERGVGAAIARSEADLRPVIEALSSLKKSRDALFADISVYARELRDMAQDVQRISMQVRLLSFNAAVEAAKAGEYGASFAVVASEMRQLSSTAGETASRMERHVEVIGAVVARVQRGEGTAVDSEIVSVARAQAVIGEVIERFRTMADSMSRSVDTMEAEARDVRDEIADALVALQFQDRVSQIQAHVVSGARLLRDILERRREAPVNLDEWLLTISAQFSTAEEFRNLQAGPCVRTSADGKHEVTYF